MSVTKFPNYFLVENCGQGSGWWCDRCGFHLVTKSFLVFWDCIAQCGMRGNYVYVCIVPWPKITPHDSIEDGCLALNAIQRRCLKVSNGDPVSVERWSCMLYSYFETFSLGFLWCAIVHLIVPMHKFPVLGQFLRLSSAKVLSLGFLRKKPHKKQVYLDYWMQLYALCGNCCASTLPLLAD